MRKLLTKDLFALSRCIKAMGIKDELKKIAMEADSKEDVAEKGFDILFSVIEAASEKQSEKAIYEFLSGPFEMQAQDIETMDITELIQGVREIADVATWKSFFKMAVH